MMGAYQIQCCTKILFSTRNFVVHSGFSDLHTQGSWQGSWQAVETASCLHTLKAQLTRGKTHGCKQPSWNGAAVKHRTAAHPISGLPEWRLQGRNRWATPLSALPSLAYLSAVVSALQGAPCW